EAPVDREEDANAEQVPDELVEEGWVVVAVVPARLVAQGDPGLVRLVDAQRPRQARRLAVELLIEVVPPAADPLREQETRRDRVHHQPDAVARAAHDHGARTDARGDGAPDAKTAVPDRREAPPVLVDRRILAP